MESNKIMRVGLDMSITSTGLCIDIDGFKKLYIIVDRELTKNQKCDDCEYIVYDRILEAGKDNRAKGLEYDMVKLMSYENAANTVFKLIKKYIKLYSIEFSNVFIYFEKPSLQSKGQAALEIPIINAIIRRKLLTLLDIRNFIGFTPSKLKKDWTGKGNANKTLMEEVYRTKKGLPLLTKKIKGTKIDDIIDAIALVEINK